MKKEEMKGLIEALCDEEMDLGMIPAGASAGDIQNFILGYMTCVGKVQEWNDRPTKESRFEEILESVDAGKRQRPEQWTEKEMSGEEDRDQIVRILQELLQHTRAGAALVALRRIPGEEPMKDETVEAEFMNGSKKWQSIDGDSGIAIIRDVLKMF